MKHDYLNGTEYKIEQGQDMFHFGSDTELLGRFMDIRKSDSVLDIGTNNGALLFYASEKGAKSLCGIDLFEEVIALAEHNFEINHVEAELHVSQLQTFEHAKFDVIVCNPPYFNTKADHLKNESPFIRAARHEEFLNPAELMEHASRLLKSNGRLQIVSRPERLAELIREAEKNNLFAERMKLAYQSSNKQAKTLLLSFRKNQKRDLLIEAPAFLDDRASFGWKGERHD